MLFMILLVMSINTQLWANDEKDELYRQEKSFVLENFALTDMNALLSLHEMLSLTPLQKPQMFLRVFYAEHDRRAREKAMQDPDILNVELQQSSAGPASVGPIRNKRPRKSQVSRTKPK